MNCRPGDLARIVGTMPVLGLNDRIVRLAKEAPTFCPFFQLWEWRLEEPIDVIPAMRIRSIQTGQVLEAGEVGEVTHMPDTMLRPIRDPGEDAVDEIVAKVGPAPMTATEILDWSEA